MKNKNKKLNEPLKLMRWAIDRYPPIDLNANFMHVVELTKEIKKLRYEAKPPTNLHIEENLEVIHNANTFNAENYLK